jgi:phage FluMu protein Com
MKVVCRKCRKYLFDSDGTVRISKIICRGCKTAQTIKIVDDSSSESDVRRKVYEPDDSEDKSNQSK